MNIQIRPAHSWADYLACEEIQRQVWRTFDNRDIVPASLLITAAKNGGVLLCAFDGDAMVGFVFGFLGTESDPARQGLKHCSHMLAVLPAYRSLGVGIELKWRQRQALVGQGLELATWTYDPLQAVNARLNLARLGGAARRYIRDAYGEMFDELNAGVASDRFEVEWWISSERVLARLAPDFTAISAPPDVLPIYNVAFDEGGLLHIRDEREMVTEAFLLEIPRDFNVLRARDLRLAGAWRQQTRSTFEKAFEEGYVAVDFVLWQDNRGQNRAGYVIEKTDLT